MFDIVVSFKANKLSTVYNNVQVQQTVSIVCCSFKHTGCKHVYISNHYSASIYLVVGELVHFCIAMTVVLV